MAQIPLTRGYSTIVDDEDAEWLEQWKWYYNQKYACRAVIKNKKQIKIMMHRQILGLEKEDKRVSDHISMKTLDNRRCNLRICTRAENVRNTKRQRNNKSGFMGVFWCKQHKKWLAYIYYNHKKRHLGSYSNKVDAAKAYDEAAKKYFKEFATFNFEE